jgi:hypothetical protein
MVTPPLKLAKFGPNLTRLSSEKAMVLASSS